MPTPTRDGATFQTNVPGCFIIGYVSGVPLIKNAVKEGADVIAHMLAANGYPDGAQELPGTPAVLDKIMIDAKK